MCLSSYPLFAFAVAKGRGIPSWLAFVSLGKRKPFIAVIKLLFKCLSYPRLLPVTCPPHQLLLQIRVRVGISIHITVRITPCIHLRQGIPFISSRIHPAGGREERVTSPGGWTGCRRYAAIGTDITPCAVYHVPVIWWLPLHNSIKQ